MNTAPFVVGEKVVYARGEHCHCGERHEDPSQAGTRLALHQLLVRSDDQDCDEKEGGQQPVDDSCLVERFHRVNASEVQCDGHCG